jgi:hypothetical protein
MKFVFILLFLLYLPDTLLFQKVNSTKYGNIYKFESENTSFPHNDRRGGHVYKGKHYDAENHYNDSSVMLFIPNYYHPKDSIDLVFYFHGWYNNIDSTIIRFKLLEQFYKSKKNAVLVLAETAKNAPDTHGGKLQEKGVFVELVNDIFDELEDVFNKEYKVGNISLAGHSGAYRVMSYILLHGGITSKIDAVYLFDALYGDIEKYTYWINNYNGKFINIYTPSGGTKYESENLKLCFDSWEIGYDFIEDDDFSSDDLKENRIIIIQSELGHNEIIHNKNQFQKILESSL